MKSAVSPVNICGPHRLWGSPVETQSFCCSSQRDDQRAIEALPSNERTLPAARYPLSNGLATSSDVVPAKAGTHCAAPWPLECGFRLRGNDEPALPLKSTSRWGEMLSRSAG